MDGLSLLVTTWLSLGLSVLGGSASKKDLGAAGAGNRKIPRRQPTPTEATDQRNPTSPLCGSSSTARLPPLSFRRIKVVFLVAIRPHEAQTNAPGDVHSQRIPTTNTCLRNSGCSGSAHGCRCGLRGTGSTRLTVERCARSPSSGTKRPPISVNRTRRHQGRGAAGVDAPRQPE